MKEEFRSNFEVLVLESVSQGLCRCQKHDLQYKKASNKRQDIQNELEELFASGEQPTHYHWKLIQEYFKADTYIPERTAVYMQGVTDCIGVLTHFGMIA